MEPDFEKWKIESLEDDVVKLKLLRESDFDDLYEVASNPGIWVEHPISDRYKKEVFRIYFDQAMSSTAAFLIIDKSTNKIIGCTRFHDYNIAEMQVGIGFTFLAREYWGSGFNEASKRLLVDFAFQFVYKVYFLIGSENVRPQVAVMKLGAKLDGKMYYTHGAKKIQQLQYVLLKHCWRIKPGVKVAC